jgi:opacity protein-like surface antigen
VDLFIVKRGGGGHNPRGGRAAPPPALINVMEFSRLTTPTTAPSQVNSRWNFAWAAMAGLSYSFSPHFLVDLGYRYLNMGDITTQPDFFNNSLTIQSLQAHEFRLGARYMFD